jgi:hypothetical protein
MLRTGFAILVMLTVGASAAPGDPSACPGRTRLADHSGKAIYLADDTLYFRTSAIELDIDGSPAAYGARDQGTENICNGLAPRSPPSCKGKISGSCYPVCQSAFRAWNGNPATLKNHMCSIGLGGGHCSEPQVRLQSPPRADWFVSETAYHPKPEAGVGLNAWKARQEGQLDPRTISYFVIPGNFRGLPWDATPGDAGVAVGPTGRSAFFLIGDSGGRLNEGSAALLAKLRGLPQLPTRSKRNAFGIQVERLEGAVEGDYRVAIFRHSARRVPGDGTVLDIAAADIPEWIDEVGRDKLDGVGGIARVKACS